MNSKVRVNVDAFYTPRSPEVPCTDLWEDGQLDAAKTWARSVLRESGYDPVVFRFQLLIIFTWDMSRVRRDITRDFLEPILLINMRELYALNDEAAQRIYLLSRVRIMLATV